MVLYLWMLAHQCLLVHFPHSVTIKVNDTRLGLQQAILARLSKDLCTDNDNLQELIAHKSLTICSHIKTMSLLVSERWLGTGLVVLGATSVPSSPLVPTNGNSTSMSAAIVIFYSCYSN